MWLDRTGRSTEGAVVASGRHVDFRLSPNGEAVAIAELDRETSSSDIFVIDFSRGERQRITSSRATDASPVWSPDGRRLVFRSNRDGAHDLYVAELDVSKPEARLVKSLLGKYPTSWSSDGRIAFHTGGIETRWDVLAADTRGGSAVSSWHGRLHARGRTSGSERRNSFSGLLMPKSRRHSEASTTLLRTASGFWCAVHGRVCVLRRSPSS